MLYESLTSHLESPLEPFLLMPYFESFGISGMVQNQRMDLTGMRAENRPPGPRALGNPRYLRQHRHRYSVGV